jgi:nucleoid-associated protein EbfC
MSFLGGLGGLANLGNMMKQAQEMQGRMQQLNEQMKLKRVSGTSGGGMIEVTLNGTGEAVAVRIAPDLFERNDRELMEDLLPTAFNDAQRKVQEMRQQAIAEVTGGMNLPGMDGMIEKLTGGDPDK